MGEWFLDFSFWLQGYRTVQTAHCAMFSESALLSNEVSNKVKKEEQEDGGRGGGVEH